MKTGRPMETPTARYPGSDPAVVVPGPLGAHSWHPMSYSPVTGLVYIPVQDAGFVYKSPDKFEAKKLAANYGVDVVAQPAWSVNRPGPWNGGTLSTAGNLVFEGIASGNFEAYRADTGEKVWSFPAQTGVIAGPIAYTANGEQYVECWPSNWVERPVCRRCPTWFSRNSPPRPRPPAKPR
jgi:hypothetical protein